MRAAAQPALGSPAGNALVVPGEVVPSVTPSLPQGEERVVEVRILGNRAVSKAKVLNQIQTRAGRPFRKEVVEQDVRILAQKGWFIDVRPYYERVPGGRVVIFQLTERPVLRYVQYLGNEGVRDRHLAKETGLKVGDALDPYAVDEGRRKITEYYQERGYNDVRVTILEGNQTRDQGAVYLINEGQAQRIWKVEFVGNTIASDARLKTQVQSKPGFFWIFKGYVDRDQIDADLQRLTAYYRSLGFFRARIGRELKFNEDGNWLTLVFVIDEGPRYKIRSVSFVGNKKFESAALAAGTELQQGEYFNQAEMNQDVTMLRDVYGSQGHVFADINASPRTDEFKPEIDLVYEVNEGQQYRVGRIRVHVQGDYPHTRRQAVLNRISLRPGDIVDIRELRRSERLLRASSIFENNPQTGQAPRIVFSPPGTDPPPVARRRRRGSSSRGGGPDLPPRGSGGRGFRGQSPDDQTVAQSPASLPDTVSAEDEDGVLVPRVRPGTNVIDFEFYSREQMAGQSTGDRSQQPLPARRLPSPNGSPHPHGSPLVPPAGILQQALPRRLPSAGEEQTSRSQTPDASDARSRNAARPILRGQSPGYGGYPVYSPGPSDGLQRTDGSRPDSAAALQNGPSAPLDPAAHGVGGLPPAGQSYYQNQAAAAAVQQQPAQPNAPSQYNPQRPLPSQQQFPQAGRQPATSPGYGQANPYAQRGPSAPAAAPQNRGGTAAPYGGSGTPSYGPDGSIPGSYGNASAAPPGRIPAAGRMTAGASPYAAQPNSYAAPSTSALANSFGQRQTVAQPGLGGAPGTAPPVAGAPYVPPGAMPPPGTMPPPGSFGTAAPAGTPPPGSFVTPGPGGAPLFPDGGLGTAAVVPPERYPLLPFDVYVDETQTGRFMLGVGVNSDAGVVGSITVDERNFDILRFPRSWEDFRNGTAWRGAGQRFRLEALPGSEVQRYLVSFQEPYLFDSAISLGLSGFFFDRRFREWDEQRLGGRVTLGYQLTPDLSVSVAYRAEEVNIHDAISPQPIELTEVLGDNVVHGFKTTVVNDTRDSSFLATEGHYLSLSFEQVIGTFSYPRAELDLRRYFLVTQRPDGSGRQVVSLTGRAGFSGSDTPLFDHFFIGGFSTLRGFDFRGVGPFKSGVYTGGEFMLVGSLEYLVPITANDMLRAVAFVDVGTVEEDVEINKLRVAPGIGLRVTVPALGPAPIALDFAFPVVEAESDVNQVFSFNIGFLR